VQVIIPPTIGRCDRLHNVAPKPFSHSALSAYRFLAFESREAQITRRDLPPINRWRPTNIRIGPTIPPKKMTPQYCYRCECIACPSVSVNRIAAAESRSSVPGHIGGNWIGVLEITGACLSWGIDNNLTQRVSLRDPVAVARTKTLAAGSCVLAIALWQRGGEIPGAITLVCAGAVGALCYGVSIVLAVKALRVLGAARESAYFATAPFVGAVLSIVVFRDLPNLLELAGATLMIIGVMILVRERHGHLHAHEAIFHEHLHVHDERHHHQHNSLVTEPDSHPHVHAGLTHEHEHVSDVHHRHSH
jgi:hypothetical protein